MNIERMTLLISSPKRSTCVRSPSDALVAIEQGHTTQTIRAGAYVVPSVPLSSLVCRLLHVKPEAGSRLSTLLIHIISRSKAKLYAVQRRPSRTESVVPDPPLLVSRAAHGHEAQKDIDQYAEPPLVHLAACCAALFLRSCSCGWRVSRTTTQPKNKDFDVHMPTPRL